MNKFAVGYEFYVAMIIFGITGYAYIKQVIRQIKSKPSKKFGTILYSFLTFVALVYSAEYLYDLLDRLGVLELLEKLL